MNERPEGTTPGARSATLDVPSSALFLRLKELTHADPVSPERDGRNLIFRPAIGQTNALHWSG